MKKLGLTAAAILSVAFIACATKPQIVEVIGAEVINDQNNVTQDLAQALSRAELIRDAAPVEDLVGRAVIEGDTYELNQRLKAAKALLTKNQDVALPGDKEAAKRFAAQTSQQLDDAIADATALDERTRKEDIPSGELADQAKSLEDHIRLAAEDHASLMDNIAAAQEIDMVVWEDILPHHALASNHAAAIRHASRMLANDNMNVDSKKIWTREAALMEKRLNSAEKALSLIEAKLEPEAEARPLVGEIRALHQSALEDVAALKAELSKTKPNFDKAKALAKSAQDEIVKAQAEHRRMLEKDHLGPYPEYEYKDEF